MNQRQESRCDQPQMHLGGVVVWLRMVTVDLRQRLFWRVLLEKLGTTDDGEFEIGETALVASFACIADDHGKYVDAQVIVFRPGKRRRDQVTAIPATYVEHNRCLAAK